MRIKDKHKAFGHRMYGYLHGKPSCEIIERHVKVARYLSITKASKKPGVFKTILMIRKNVSERLGFLLIPPDELNKITAQSPWRVSVILSGTA